MVVNRLVALDVSRLVKALLRRRPETTMNKPYRVPASPNAPSPTVPSGPTPGMGSEGDRVPDHVPAIPWPAPDNGPKPFKF